MSVFTLNILNILRPGRGHKSAEQPRASSSPAPLSDHQSAPGLDGTMGTPPEASRPSAALLRSTPPLFSATPEASNQKLHSTADSEPQFSRGIFSILVDRGDEFTSVSAESPVSFSCSQLAASAHTCIPARYNATHSSNYTRIQLFLFH